MLCCVLYLLSPLFGTKTDSTVSVVLNNMQKDRELKKEYFQPPNKYILLLDRRRVNNIPYDPRLTRRVNNICLRWPRVSLVHLEEPLSLTNFHFVDRVRR